MPQINSYPRDISINGTETLLGTDTNTGKSNNFLLQDIKDYINRSANTGAVSLKTNGGIVKQSDELAIDLGASSITGQLANSDLANSSITINGVAISLGGSVTTPNDNTQLSTEQVQDIVGAMFTGNTETRIAATYEDGDGTIDLVVDDMTANTQNTTTLSFVDSSNDILLRNTTSGATSGTQDIKFVAGSNVTLAHTDANNITISSQAFGTVHTVSSESAMISATSTSGDIVIRTDVSKTFIHNGGTAGTAADFNELQFSGINNLALTAGDGIDLSRTTVTNTNNDLTITNSLATASERGGIKIGYVDNGRNYAVELDSEKAYVNVPWTDNDTVYTHPTHPGDDIDIDTTALTGATVISDLDINITTDTEGHVTDANGTVATRTLTLANLGYTGATDANNFVLPTAASDTLGGIKVGTNLSINGSGVLSADSQTDNNFTTTLKNKLDGIEANATADQSNAEIRTAVEAATDSNVFTDADHTKLNAIEANATADQTASEIRALVEAASDSNVFTDSDHTKLNGIATGAQVNVATNLSQTTAAGQLTIESSTGDDIVVAEATGSIAGLMSTVHHDKLDGIEDNADVTDTANVRSSGALMDDEVTDLPGVKGVTISTLQVKPSEGAFADGDKTKLNGIETGATADQTDAEIRTAVENASDSNVFTDNDHSKLNGIEAGATADQSDSEIKTAYENNSDTNAFTDALLTKLNAIEASATADQTDAEIRDAVEAASNSNTFTDADHTKLNGIEASATADQTITAGNGLTGGGTGNVTLTNALFSDGKFFTVTANAGGSTLSLAQGLAASWNDSNGNGEVDIFFRDGGTNHATNTLHFNSFNGTDTKQVLKLGGASTAATTYVDVSGRLLVSKDKLEIDSTAVTTTAAELNVLDGVSAGTVSASKAVVAGSLKDIAGFRTITLEGIPDEGGDFPQIVLNDASSGGTSTTYLPGLYFQADGTTKAQIGKLANNTNNFTAAKNHDGPVNIITSDLHSGHVHNPEYVFGYEPPSSTFTWGLLMKGDATTSNSLYMDPDANNHNSSIFFGGQTNALNVTRISHNQSLGTLLMDVPDAGSSNLSVKFRQFNSGGFMQNMIDFEDDGDIKNINGSYGTISSDRRVKENIVDATPKLNDILSLNVKNFNFIGDNKKQIGLIAQDVESIFPSWVQTSDTRIYKTHDENGVPLEEQGELVSGLEDGKSLKVGMEFAVLVKTIQELNAKIVALEAKVQKLENN